MPQGRRKVPFSTKQKKTQLQQKRERKKETGESSEGPNVLESESSIVSSVSSSGKQFGSDSTKLNEQPSGIANRYNLVFKKESKEEINKRKEEARKPICSQSKKNLEVSYHEFYKNSLDHNVRIPRRPPWDYSLSKEKLLALEEKYFREYLNELENTFGGQLSYMELNLETWRQLWRVLEMSDIVIILADIRHPVLHFSPALFEYVTKDLKKDVILVLNKIDLVPPSLAVAWKSYFKSIFPTLHVVCLTAFAGVPKNSKKRRKYKLAQGIPQQILSMCKEIVGNAVDLKSWETKIKEETSGGTDTHDDDDADENDDDDDDKEEYKANPLATAEVHIVQNDTSYYTNQRYSEGILTLGFVGHPNVGKSSVLNSIMGKKVVSVSRTPGHTKHFQTIFLTHNVKLCDCPGLVFPSLAPKQLQVLSGCFPIAQVREPYSVVGYFSQYLPIQKIMKIVHPEGEEEWTAYDICEAWAIKKGFRTAKTGRPDVYKAANYLLRMALDGRTICLSFFPPGYLENKSKWEESSEVIDVLKQLNEEDAKGNIIVSSSEESGEDETTGAAASVNKFQLLSEGGED